MKTFLIGIALVLLGLSTVFGLQYFGLVNYKFFAPKYENVRRNVYENTQSYVEGKRQEVLKYKLEYDLAKTEEEKTALKYIIVNTTVNLDLELLPPDLKYFVLSLR